MLACHDCMNEMTICGFCIDFWIQTMSWMDFINDEMYRSHEIHFKWRHGYLYMKIVFMLYVFLISSWNEDQELLLRCFVLCPKLILSYVQNLFCLMPKTYFVLCPKLILSYTYSMSKLILSYMSKTYFVLYVQNLFCDFFERLRIKFPAEVVEICRCWIILLFIVSNPTTPNKNFLPWRWCQPRWFIASNPVTPNFDNFVPSTITMLDHCRYHVSLWK